MPERVFVSGCYDLLNSGHVEFFKKASQYGAIPLMPRRGRLD